MMPTNRLLRALRWHDWIEPIDLYDQLEIDRNSTERAAYHSAMTRLVKIGAIERRVVRHRSLFRTKRGYVSTTYVRLAPQRKATQVSRSRAA